MVSEFYEQWKEARRRIQAPDDTCGRVMRLIREKGAAPSLDLWDQWLRPTQWRLFRQWAAVGALLLVGLFRIIYTTAQFFWPGYLTP